MDLTKQRKFNERMGKRLKYYKGGTINRQYLAGGGTLASDVSSAGAGAAAGAAAGSIIPGIGTVIGGAIGAIGGFLSGLFGGGSSQAPQPPNITDPVTGAQITDANGNVVASQQQLQSFAQALTGANGVQNQQAVVGQLQQVANGQGVNPALAQLAATTASNISQQSAQQASQRGASSNVGLAARQAGELGAQTQQQASGQAAALESQQQLNALNSEGAIAGQQVGETQNALTAAGTQATTNQGQLLGAQGQYNTQVVQGQGNVNTSNQQQQQTNLGAAQQATNAAGAAITGINAQKNAAPPPPPPPTNAAHGGLIHKAIPGPHKSHVANFLFAKGGKVPAMVSPGEVYLSPEKVGRVLDGENPLKAGEHIAGKAKVKGDSLKNDIVPKTLEEGGVVLPRHIVNTKDPEKAALFVHRAVHMKRKGK